jgi:hypothetical protein
MYHQGCPVDTIPEDVNPVRYVMSDEEWQDLVLINNYKILTY